MEIGAVQSLSNGGKCFEHVGQFGLKVCQLVCWDSTLNTKEVIRAVKEDSKQWGVRIAAVWGGWSGPAAWNFTEGPITLGIVPEQYRRQRLDELKRWADFAAELEAPALITHCGFIPENMTDPMYDGVVEAIKEIAIYCEDLGLGFWFETGQETPVVLLRTIERVGTSNLGINLDPANLLMYGKGNPIDSLDVIGKYVKNVHVKDGFYPTEGSNLGREVFPGEGLVRFPEFIPKLKQIGFDGELIIEREISGEQQIKDIRRTVTNLETWLNG